MGHRMWVSEFLIQHAFGKAVIHAEMEGLRATNIKVVRPAIEAAADISDRCLMINAKALILELPSGRAPNDGYRSSYVGL